MTTSNGVSQGNILGLFYLQSIEFVNVVISFLYYFKERGGDLDILHQTINKHAIQNILEESKDQAKT